MGITFKVGDVVRCKRGFLGNGETSQMGRNPVYGGAAYEEGNVYTIRWVNIYSSSSSQDRDVAFFEECANGVFMDALEYVDRIEPTMFLSKFKFV